MDEPTSLSGAESPADSARAEDPAIDDPTPAEGAEIATAEADEMTRLIEASQKVRLPPVEEERMAQLLKEALQGGRAGVSRAIEALPKAPWIVGVRAVEAVWPELTPGFRSQLLAGLGRDESDGSRRIRLSLARAFFKIDVPTALKLAVAAARELPDAESGGITPKHAQIFANVLIGRGKPWLTQIALDEVKPADGDALVHCAILAAFTLPHPPITQLGILKWAAEQQRLDKLAPSALELVKKGVARWSNKWQAALRKEIDVLPEEIAGALKLPGERRGESEQDASEQSSDEGMMTRPSGAASGSEADTAETDPLEDDDEEDTEDSPKARPVYEPRPQKYADRPVYTPRLGTGAASKNFNLNEVLRQIDGYVQSLRGELGATQAKLRAKEDRRRPEKLGPIIEGEPTVEELARLNQQLEARNEELQARITELMQHAEDIATSTGVLTGEPVNDGGTQLRTLIALKLQEDFADFRALQTESNDIVVQQHYKELLRHVFEVLQQLDVRLKEE